jgi:NADPH-dependent 2,4-dienoyl-CoA reductase/sulfur reductase-like enzyme
VGDLVRTVHDEHGVQFRFGRTATAVTAGGVRLSDGEELPADLVVAGVGVRPNLALAESAGLEVNGGVVADSMLGASAPGVWVAGDVARYPDPRTGDLVRIEHWVVAGRQGRTAARNALGLGEPFRDVPFFWTWQHDLWLGYEGHAEGWDEIAVDGSLESRRALVRYRAAGRDLAVLAVNRSRKLLDVEAEFENQLTANS